MRAIFAGYGIDGPALDAAVAAVTARPEPWLRFMMKEELGLEEPDPKRAVTSALTIGGAYVAGGLAPLLPFLAPLPVERALLVSAVVTLSVLALFGAVKARFTGLPPIRGAAQTVFLGGAAAAVAFILARTISGLVGA